MKRGARAKSGAAIRASIRRAFSLLMAGQSKGHVNYFRIQGRGISRAGDRQFSIGKATSCQTFADY
jgi:hypothetical protein